MPWIAANVPPPYPGPWIMRAEEEDVPGIAFLEIINGVPAWVWDTGVVIETPIRYHPLPSEEGEEKGQPAIMVARDAKGPVLAVAIPRGCLDLPPDGWLGIDCRPGLNLTLHVGLANDSKAEWVEAFFGEDAKLTWHEGPYSDKGKSNEVHHYRLFCDPAWQPIKPRGEVYSKDWTPAEWKSFSDVHAEISP